MKPLPGGAPLFDGVITERVRLGSDLRGGYAGTFQENGPYVGEFRLTGANLYLTVDLLPDRLTLYADEKMAPGGAVNREAFALLRGERAGLYVKLGKLFLPYGLRLQDDDAVTRRFTGFNFNNQDVGVEVGAESHGWSGSLGISNGNGGGSEVNNGKQLSWVGAYARPGWRAGLSASSNDLPGDATRKLGGAFLGASGGPITVLAEVDTIRDDAGLGTATRSSVGHVELDWTPHRGFLVRVWRGRYDPDRDTDGDRQDQTGAGIDWTVWPGLQVRSYYRARSGSAETAGTTDDQAVAELHLFF
jgi:hypothetical protein